ncbi:hypothetical protein GBAR_LOCUS14930, partial [Geodia barretti]
LPWKVSNLRRRDKRDKYLFCLPLSLAVPPAPNVTVSSSGLSIAGQSYYFKCSASVLAGLVAEPHMKIVFPNTTEISVVATKTLYHTFSSLRISDGGQYTCTATINIPQAGVTNIQSSVAKTLAVVCKCLPS